MLKGLKPLRFFSWVVYPTLKRLCEKTELTLNPSLGKRGTYRICAQTTPSLLQEKGPGDEFCDSHTLSEGWGYLGCVNSPDLLYESYDSQSRRQVGDSIQNETSQQREGL
jgi:hypothetical protein